MKLAEIRAIAAQRGVKAGRMNKGELIRAIQAAEGNNACFGSGAAETCGQTACLWRADCT
ncbi:MAG TPA: Rho termination factor N-terminal domain-containing protein [Geobacteraceae bacterium]